MSDSLKPDRSKALFDRQLAFFLFRVTLGVNMLMHGAVRIPILKQFAEGLAREFTATVLPAWFVRGFGLMLPFIEAIIGLLLLVGLGVRWAAAAGAALTVVLIFGSSLQQNWGAVGTQMVYAIAFWILLSFRADYDRWSLDREVSKPAF